MLILKKNRKKYGKQQVTCIFALKAYCSKETFSPLKYNCFILKSMEIFVNTYYIKQDSIVLYIAFSYTVKMYN